jgi:hypothetical protein
MRTKCLLLKTALTALLAICMQTASATIHYVKPADADPTVWQGQTRIYTSLNDAYAAAANSGDQIWIAAEAVCIQIAKRATSAVFNNRHFVFIRIEVNSVYTLK